MQAATSKLSEISTTVAGPLSTQAPRDSTELDEKLGKILDNQKVIMDPLVHHGSVIEVLTKQAKKMRKSQASKKSVNVLREEVTRLAIVGDFILLDPDQSAPDPFAQFALAGQFEEPCLAVDTTDAMRVMFTTPATPKYDDDIQLVEPTEVDAAGDTEMFKDA
nr:uncharacterized protein LOC117278585 [Nicotiana tomentosiformis]